MYPFDVQRLHHRTPTGVSLDATTDLALVSAEQEIFVREFRTTEEIRVGGLGEPRLREGCKAV